MTSACIDNTYSVRSARKNNEKRRHRTTATTIPHQKEDELQKNTCKIIELSDIDGIMSYPFGVHRLTIFLLLILVRLTEKKRLCENLLI